MIIRALILCVFLVPSLAGATTYYADFDTGSDANNGLTTSTPWKRLPGMVGETVTPDFSSGDIVCLKGGVTWTDRLLAQPGVLYYSVGGSNTAVAACVGWGSGKAIIDIPLTTDTLGAFKVQGDGDNVTVDGLRLINRDTTSANTKCGFYVEGSAGAGNNVVNLTVRNIEGTLSANGLCIIGYADTWSITDSQFDDNIGNISQSNCNGNGMQFSAKATADVINGTVLRVYARRNGLACFNGADNEGRGISFINEGSTVLVQDSWFIGNGETHDGAAIDAGGYNNVTLRGNYFDGWTAAEIKANFDDCVVDGNVFVGRSIAVFQYGYFSTGGDSVGCHFTNNTIVSLTETGSKVVHLSSAGTTTIFRNNLIICPPGNTTAAIKFEQDTGWAQSTWNNNIDHNMIEGCAYFSEEVPSGAATLVKRTLAEHQAAYPLQAQATKQASNLSILKTTATPRQYKPYGTSPALRGGAITWPCQDVRGRVCHSPPDIGGYQQGSGDPR